MTLLDLVSWITWVFSPLLAGPLRPLVWPVVVGSGALRTPGPSDLSNPGEHFLDQKSACYILVTLNLGGIPQTFNVLP